MRQPRLIPLSICAVGLALAATYIVLLNQHHITRATLPYTLDGTTPWGDATRRDPEGHPPVLIYQRDSPTTFCYDAIFYEPLRQRLLASHPAAVTVEYNHFYNFLLEPIYNVQSIDGMLLTNGDKILVDEWDSEGGTMETTDLRNDHNKIQPCPR